MQLPGDKIVGLAKFLLGVGIPGDAKDFFNQIDALACLEDNRQCYFHAPYEISLQFISVHLRRDFSNLELSWVKDIDRVTRTLCYFCFSMLTVYFDRRKLFLVILSKRCEGLVVVLHPRIWNNMIAVEKNRIIKLEHLWSFSATCLFSIYHLTEQ